MINIVLAINNQYIKQVSALIMSIHKNSKKNSSIRIPFSFLNNLEELDFDHVKLDIYDLAKNKTNIELLNLKSLYLSNSQF